MTEQLFEEFIGGLREEARTFTNFAVIFDKADGDGYLRALFDCLAQVFDREIRFTAAELNRSQTLNMKLPSLAKLIERNLFIFKENLKVIVLAAVEQLWRRQLELGRLQRLLRPATRPANDTILEEDEEQSCELNSFSSLAQRAGLADSAVVSVGDPPVSEYEQPKLVLKSRTESGDAASRASRDGRGPDSNALTISDGAGPQEPSAASLGSPHTGAAGLARARRPAPLPTANHLTDFAAFKRSLLSGKKPESHRALSSSHNGGALFGGQGSGVNNSAHLAQGEAKRARPAKARGDAGETLRLIRQKLQRLGKAVSTPASRNTSPSLNALAFGADNAQNLQQELGRKKETV